MFAALALSTGLAACGSKDKSGTSTAATTTATQPAKQPSGALPTVSADLKSKPVVKVPDALPPDALTTKDIVTGTGAAAKAGDNITVQYEGLTWAGKKQFDASWDRGQAFPFTLGGGQVIPGWDKGIAGMKVGGRRLLVIPPELGYGAAGTPDGSIPPNATLVFVVDLKKIG